MHKIYSLILGGNQHRSILLSDVSTLTLHKGQRTQARRVSSIPQLRCVGGSAKGQYEPDVVQCYNRGTDGVDIQVGDRCYSKLIFNKKLFLFRF